MQQKFTLFALAGLAALVKPSVAGYALEDDYSADNFFSMFNFFTDADPTHGTVEYVSQSEAQSSGLIKNLGESVFMGVDNSSITSGGRKSVRVTSHKAYNTGLVVLDVAHMPEGCGTWPAFWMTGPNWPNSGEIDIIEGVNDQSSNSMTLHTTSGCTISKEPMTGSIETTNCDVNAAGQSNNQGCGISAGSGASTTYGSGFNAIDGGVYATEWTGTDIKIWFFPRSSVPSDALGANPNPNNWGTPVANFQGDCPIDSHFKDLNIVFDTTFCGDWAGNTWSSSTCASKASSCEAFVQNNPSAFSNAYWDVKSLKVYTQDASNAAPVPIPSIAVSLGLSVGAPASTAAPVTSATPVPVAMSEVAAPAPSSAADAEPSSSSAPSIHVVHWSDVAAAATPAASSDAATPVASTVVTATATPASSGPMNVVVGPGGGPLQEQAAPAPTPAEGELGWGYFHHGGKRGVHRHLARHLHHKA